MAKLFRTCYVLTIRLHFSRTFASASTSKDDTLKQAFVLREVTKQYPGRVLFKDVNLSFLYGAKIGVLGSNGAGKSSLLKIIAGVDKNFTGIAEPTPGLRVGYLSQEPTLDSDKTVEENIMSGLAYKNEIKLEFEEICKKFTESGVDMEALNTRFGELESQMQALDVYNIEHNIKVAMRALRCPPPQRLCSDLSGGEKRRVALCRLLLSQPDILLLDEPTNHLDIDSRTWLETFLTSYKGLVISITHDRYFLDNVAQYILEVEAGRLHPFTGNYGAWIRHKEQRLIAEQKKDKNMEKIIAQELAWSKKNPKGQQAKSKAMLNSLEKKTVQRDVLSIARRIESGSLVIPEGPRLGDNVVEIKNLSYQINNRVVFENLSFSLSPGKVVGILGPNGSGKTTLLKCITQCHAPTSGTIKVGGSVRIGYNAQTRDTLNDKKTVWEEVCGGRDEIEVTKGTTIPARNYVAQFNFKGADQQKRIGELSGGERNRVSLAKSLAQGCNLIILDEPTNDLDINTMQKLEEALKEFNGAAIVVTHDRKFLESLADELIIFQEEGGKVMYYPGTYEEWRKSRNGDSEALKSRKHRKFASA